jgi:ABC-type polysaccharide/polyol phosphate export permease
VRDQSALFGLIWSFCNPIIMTTVLYFLFRTRFSTGTGIESFLYILAGTIFWGFFQSSLTTAIQGVSGRRDIARNVVFPKEILVISQVCSRLIQFFFEIFLMLLVAGILGTRFSFHVLLLPLIVLSELFLIIGLGLFFSVIVIYVYDTAHLLSSFMGLLFFLTPVFYKPSALSLWAQRLVWLNPVSYFVTFARDVILYHRFPAWDHFFYVTCLSVIIFFAGYKFFKSQEDRIVEAI